MKQENIEQAMIAAYVKAAAEDPEFQTYISLTYAPAQLRMFRQTPSTLATLHHAFLAGLEVGKLKKTVKASRIPLSMRTTH